MVMTQIVIGFAGRAGAGKTTAAAHLVAAHGFERIRFAGLLKAMMRALGCTEEEVDGAHKEVPCDLLGGRTPRQAMQWLGTEWGREMIAPDLWTRAWTYAAAGRSRVVVDDVRFPNEVEAIRALGGIVVRIDADAAGSTSGAGHISEHGTVTPDRLIFNCSDARFLGVLDRLAAERVARADAFAGAGKVMEGALD